ncbi:MAG: hypothetical protein GYA23_13690 [Methanomicrobiales archaeon]|nr:hypothetical protein [Methanomicrobiales archaeon]
MGTMVVCPQCGKTTPEGRFCEHCGASLQSVHVAAVSSSETQQAFPVQKAPPQKSGSAGRSLLIIGIIIIGVLAALAIIGYLDNPSPSPVHPTPTYKTTVPTVSQSSGHTPSEVIPGYVAGGGSYRITTYIRDPDTTAFTVRLVGPKGADLDLYIKKDAEPTTGYYDYHSSGADANEQLKVPDPGLGSYNILVQSVKGGGNFNLYITYQYG